MKVREFIDRYLAVRKCAGCGEILSYEDCQDAFCDNCRLAWRVAKTETCPICSQSAFECICMPKGLASKGTLCLRKLFLYSAKNGNKPQNRIVYFLKKNKNKRAAVFLANELKTAALEELSNFNIDISKDAAIVYVPRGRRARAAFGFDQSELICRELSKITGIPFVTAIKRRHGGGEQKKLDRRKRFRNVEALFELDADLAESIDGKYILLLDDIVTTGASMAACVSILKRAGVKGVICLCIAVD